MAIAAPDRVPVCDADGYIVERADPARVRQLLKARNVQIVRARKRGAIVRILLADSTDAEDAIALSIRSNPLSYSHNHETKTNPEKCWTLKRIHDSTADLFSTVVTDCHVTY